MRIAIRFLKFKMLFEIKWGGLEFKRVRDYPFFYIFINRLGFSIGGKPKHDYRRK